MLASAGSSPGCQDAPRTEWERAEAVAELASPASRFGIIELTAADHPGTPGLDHADTSLGTTQYGRAGFVEYVGGSRAYAEALAGFRSSAWDRLEPGSCVREDRQAGQEPSVESSLVPGEVMLLDVGNLQIGTDDNSDRFDLVLVPDLPPVFAGVSYIQRPTRLGLPRPDGVFETTVRLDAVSDVDLDAFEVTVAFPPSLALAAEVDVDAAQLRVRWSEDADGPVELTIRADEETRETPGVLCKVDAVGGLTIPVQSLHALGLPTGAPVTLTASRQSVTTIESGAFEEIDIRAQRVASVSLPSL